jgi:hypothetical protein
MLMALALGGLLTAGGLLFLAIQGWRPGPQPVSDGPILVLATRAAEIIPGGDLPPVFWTLVDPATGESTEPESMGLDVNLTRIKDAHVCWAADASAMGFLSGGTAKVVDDRPERVIADYDERQLASCSLSPDGERLALVSNGRLTLSEPGHGSMAPFEPVGPDVPVASVTWAPSGGLMAIATQPETGDHRLIVVGADTEPREIASEPTPIRSVAWSPDGSTIAYVADDVEMGQSTVIVVSAEGDERRPLFEGFYPSGISWAPTSRYLAIVYFDEGPMENLWVIDVDRGERHLIKRNVRGAPMWFGPLQDP